MATTAPAKLLTVDEFWDFCQLPENRDKSHELIRGKVVEVSRPQSPHALLVPRLCGLFFLYSEECGDGQGFTEGGLVLGEGGAVVGPDFAFFAGRGLGGRFPKWVEAPPLLAVEVLSPNDLHREVEDKVELYFGAGTRIVWLVEPELRSVTVCKDDRPRRTLRNDDDLADDDVLPGFHCTVNRLFGPRD